MARQIAGDASTGYRTTDHSEEVVHLHRVARQQSGLEALVAAAAAELLAAHDATGLSLDSWGPVRDLVEHAVGGPILENGV